MTDFKGTYIMNYERFFGENVMAFAQKEIQEEWTDSAGGNKMTLSTVAEMTPARFTKKAYDKLGTQNKKYVELEGRGHWVLDDDGIDHICNEMKEWFLYEKEL